MFRSNTLTLILLLLSGLLAVGAAVAEPRTALVIGNAAYRDTPLANPVNDAQDIARALGSMGFEVTLKKNLSKREIEQLVTDFSRRLQQRSGVGLFYYSGHGAQVNGRNYLIPVGAVIPSEADVAYEAVDAGRVLDNMELAGNSLNIVILDACRDNPFGRAFRAARGGGLTRGLAQMEAPASSLIAYATAPGMVAADGSGRNSPYTGALLAVMGNPGLGIEQVFKQVRIRVANATANRQIPWESSSLMKDFYFVPGSVSSPSITVEPVAPPPVRPPMAPVSPTPPISPPMTPVSPTPPISPPAQPPLASRQVFRDRLQDGSQGPEMVAIPGGRFMMGSPPNEPERYDNERQHEVEVKPCAIGKYEVTFEEYDRFARATGRQQPDDLGWGRGRRPVINVSWQDAVAYAKWLSQQTGQAYRLPTEAEWEYAARAGTVTPFYFGSTISTGQANYGFSRGKTVEVGQFPANAWALYDMHGNVWEWTCSEYDEGYGGGEQRCVSDAGSGGPRVLRGGSWGDGPGWLRAAARFGYDPVTRYGGAGFRLARNL